MENVHESSFNLIYLDKTKSYIEMLRKTTTAEMSEEQYKKDMLALINIIIKNNASYILIDNTKFSFILVPELQNWANTNVVIPGFRNSVKRVAFVEGDDFFANISSKQAMEDNNVKETPYKYFRDKTEALNWLSN